ncbi:hypothetical protein INR49_028726 [Caranx melampygus]|nr:hypothetical protein INR49_028726 [Caranx melampygus]
MGRTLFSEVDFLRTVYEMSTNIDPLSMEEENEGGEEEEEEEGGAAGGWNRLSQVPVRVLQAHSGTVTAARLCFNERHLLSCSSDCTAILWWKRSHGGLLTSCSISSEGRLVVCAADPQNGIYISDAASGQTLHHVSDHHRSTITRCRFDPQSQRVATVSADRSIRLWDVLVQKTTVSINSKHGNVVSDCCFTNNGHFLCTASWDKTLKLWELQAGGFRSHGGTLLQRGHEGSVSCCSFSADANLLVSGSYDRTVAFWDMSSQCPTLILKVDGTVRLWDVENMEEIPQVIEKRTTEESGIHILKCEECGKPFPVSRLQTSELLTQCVFCRLRSPSRYRPQPPPLM